MTFALRLLHRIMLYVSGFVLFALLLVLILYVGSKEYHVCIGLPNGLIIGREALFAPGRIFDGHDLPLVPRVILKLPDGSPLIRDEVFPIYITGTTVYGRGEPRDRSKASYTFAYRPDVGLVYRHVDPDTYARLESEAGELLDLLFNKYERFVFSEDSGFSYSEDGKFLITEDGRFPVDDEERTFVHMDLPAAYGRLRKEPSFLRRNCHVSLFPQ